MSRVFSGRYVLCLLPHLLLCYSYHARMVGFTACVTPRNFPNRCTSITFFMALLPKFEQGIRDCPISSLIPALQVRVTLSVDNQIVKLWDYQNLLHHVVRSIRSKFANKMATREYPPHSPSVPAGRAPAVVGCWRNEVCPRSLAAWRMPLWNLLRGGLAGKLRR